MAMERPSMRRLISANIDSDSDQDVDDQHQSKQKQQSSSNGLKQRKTGGDKQQNDTTSKDAMKDEKHHAKTQDDVQNIDDRAYLPDEEIAKHWLWKFFTYLVLPGGRWLHAFTAVIPDPEPIDRSKGLLTVTMHSTHNTDIFLGVVMTYQWSGRVCRGMVHKLVMKGAPWFRYLGCVPGERDTAIELCKLNYWVSAVPGGAEEALTGHENAYAINWPEKRKGFAKVAIAAECPIVPIFFQNVEEMRWNPILWLWHILRLYYIFYWIVDAQVPYLSKFVKTFGEAMWFNVSFIAIPIPVKVTAYIGRAIYCNKDSDVDDVVRRTKAEMTRLRDKYQPHGKSYWRGLKMRWEQPESKIIHIPADQI